MTELKVKGVDDVYVEYFNTGNHDLAKVYLKTEVDHYIAELEEKHKKEVGQLLILNREQANAANRLRDNMEQALRHQKYKRCLAMARWCRARACLYDTMRDSGLYWSVKSDRAYKWYKWWFKTAFQFKEAM